MMCLDSIPAGTILEQVYRASTVEMMDHPSAFIPLNAKAIIVKGGSRSLLRTS
jgi:hypothetical protein